MINDVLMMSCAGIFRNASRADHECHYLWRCLGIWRTLIGPPEHTGLRRMMNKTFLPMLARRWPSLQNIPSALGFTKKQAKIFEVSVRAVVPTGQSPVSKGSMMGNFLTDHIVGTDSKCSVCPTLPPGPIMRFTARREVSQAMRDHGPR